MGPAPEPRPFLVEFGVALGFLALALLALQFVASGRIRRVAPGFGVDNVLQAHRELGVVGVLFALAHPLVLVSAHAPFLEYFDPRVNAPRAVLLVLATLALVAITATSLWRTLFRLEYEWWRLVHGGLAVFIVFTGLVHALQVAHYLEPLWKRGTLAVIIGSCLYLVIHTRIVRPWRSRTRPYSVVAVQPERDECWSVTVKPVGHEGLRFVPGQFAWLTMGSTPFTLQQHPFSFASSARRRELTFTAKALGDFTATWEHIRPGTSVYLEGPFGSFTPDPSPRTGLFLVMGGIGITPAMSMLRTLRDDRDSRTVLLIYANDDWEHVTFREELEELTHTLRLTVVHVLRNPPEGWQGAEGLVTPELIDAHLPERREEFQYLVCGPDPLMDVAEESLRDAGIPWTRVYTERYSIV
jgi:predicted ferric reductase